MVEPLPLDTSELGPLYIDTAEDLQELQRTPRIARRRAICVNLPTMDESKRQAIEHRIRRGLSACGCNEGTAAGLLFLVVVPVLIFFGKLSPHTVLQWGEVAGGFVVSLLVGKLIGLTVARLRSTVSSTKSSERLNNNNKRLICLITKNAPKDTRRPRRIAQT